MKKAKKVTHIFSWIWGVRTVPKEDGVWCFFKELDLEWDTQSEWSTWETYYDGYKLCSLHFWRFRLGWGGFSEFFANGSENEIKKNGMTFFEKETVPDSQEAQ